MRSRVFILIFLLVIRCVLGYLGTVEFDSNQEISLTGNIYKTYQKDNICITHVGKFILQTEGICSTYRGTKIKAFGRVSGGLLTRFMGRISLDDGKIYRLEKNGKSQNSCGYFCELIANFREILLNRIRINVPEPESGLVAGIVLGYKKDIGQRFYEEMVNSGTIHIAVASGYNVLLVGGAILGICFWAMKRKLATYVAILAMLLYAIIAGGEPPVVRAWFMASLIFVAQALGRSNSSLWVLSLAIWMMIVWDPMIILEVSFQLSVAASVGMIVVEPWMVRRIGSWAGATAGEFLTGVGLSTSLSTMILTGPIIWAYFGRMSWVGVVSNILILPFVPVIMILTSAMFVLGPILAVPVYAVSHLMVLIIRFLGA